MTARFMRGHAMPDYLRTFQANETGRDFVVGDIHGCFFMLDELLARIGFDTACHRLFSVGDLIDRGPDSERAARYLDKPWFHAIRGNHEQMLLDATVGARPGRGRAGRLWRANGGEWFDYVNPADRKALVDAIAELPYALEIALAEGGVAALVHADVLEDSWRITRDTLQGASVAKRRLSGLVWDRDRAHALNDGNAAVAVEDVDLIFFGHTPIRHATACANTRWLDTGAVFGNSLSIAELAVDGEVWSLAEDMRACATGWLWL